MVLRKLIISVCFLTLTLLSQAQTDNLFWFAAPDISSDHGDAPKNGAPIYLHVTAVLPTTVTISQPANPLFTPITFNLDELEHRTVQLDAIMGIDQIENYPQALPLTPANTQKKAFKITSSPGDITVYYELDNYYNRDIFPLKGRNALGTRFYASTQNYFPNGNYAGTAWSGFVVAATENNTRIVVYPNDSWLYFAYTPGDSIVLNLNAGETFAFRAASTAANRHINGIPVKSDKNIVITVYDDSMRKKNSHTSDCTKNLSYDTFGDQIIPTNLIGHEYIVMKGQVMVSTGTDCPSDGGERMFITSTQPNTQIYIDNVLVTTLASAGQVFNYQIDNPTVHVYASKPVYLNHVTGFGGELGGAVLPTIDGCTGSYNVTFTRTPNTNDAFFINLMARNDTVKGSPTKNKSIESFSIFSGGSSTDIPASYFDYILDSTWIVLKKTAEVNAFITGKILPGNEARVSNSVARFHLGIINGGSTTGCKYGYFSDYKSDFVNAGIGGANATKLKTYCSVDPIHLVASGGKKYKWYAETNPTDTLRLSSTSVPDPYFSPETSGFFRFGVHVLRECFGDTVLHVGVYVIPGPVAMFEVETVEGCSPFKATITNLSDTNKAVQNYWNFDTRYSATVKQSTLTNPFTYTFPENLTDSIQRYTIRLTVKGDFNMCPNSEEKIIKIKPSLKAGYTIDTNLGCSPLEVHFNDTSIGYIDTLNTYWDFGTYQQTYRPNTHYLFYNNKLTDTQIMTKLVAVSKFGCIDTAKIPITVHPFVKANFGLTNLSGCSPFSTDINPLGSTGVQTYHWSIRDEDGIIMDSAFTRNNVNTFTFNHNDATQPNPDTLYVGMYGTNSYNCADTAITKRLIIYPEVHAIFSASEDKVCDSTEIDFTNHSVGYNLLHEWNLGDGAFMVDTTGNAFSHYYFNRTSTARDCPVTLIATSDYFCADTTHDTIAVYPFIKANFAIDYSNNCSPLNVQFTNTSKGGNDFNWKFGDGDSFHTALPSGMTHIYENNSDNDTTFFIHLRAQNSYGCADSLERSVFLFPRVVADFGFTSPNEGCNPLNVIFDNNSRGQNLDFIWDFGDKTYSTSQNPPPRVYKNSTAKDTTYFVNLTVMNLAGCDSSVTKTVKVYSKVTADYSIERVDSCSPFRIKVDNFSSGGITDYIWKYTAQDSLTLHTNADPVIPVYHNKGLVPLTYPFVLRTRNSHGCTAQKSDIITVFPEMHANFHPGKISGCEPLKVDLVNNSNLIEGTTFSWDFGDGRTSNLTSPVNHIFNNLTNITAPHTIRLQATTQYGCFDDTTITVQVYPYIYAKFSIDKPAICSDEPFAIDRNSSAGAINHYYWNYGDGTGNHEKTDAVFNHTYNNPGTTDLNPHITLTVTNAQGCDTSWTETIPVHPQAVAAFNVDNSEACYPLDSKFSNLSQPAIPMTWYWDFGDGSSSAAKSPVHNYKNFSRTDDKVFTVKLTSTTTFGCDSTISKTVRIHPKPFADFNFPKAVDCPPFAVQFTNSSLGNSLTYNWNFENGHTSTEKDPSQTFYNTGSSIAQNDVTLRVNTAFNCSDTVTKPVQIYPEVQVDFNASEWSGCSPMQINFDGTATNENEYYWYVDGKVFSNYEDPSYRFTNESSSDKTYDIRFYAVSINGCFDDTVKHLTLYPKPLAEFLPDPQAQDFDTRDDITDVTLNNQTNNQAAWNYKWTYGDGNTSTENKASFIKKYMIWGDINNENRIPVTLVATNNNHPECSDTIMHYVIIKPPLPKVEIGADVSGCMPLTVNFSATTKYIYPDSYHWDFGYNGVTSDESNPDAFEFDTAGMYIVRLSVRGDGGTNWDYKTIQVYPKPVINFDFDPKYAWLSSQTEPGTPIKFFNNTYNAEIFEWDFGDNTDKSFEKQPQHEYKKAGEFYPELRAENENGCFDVLKSDVPVIIEGHGFLEFPNAITIIPDNPAEENYDPNEPPTSHNLFRPLNQGVRRYKLEIYNRWGELIFESTDVNKGWNGFIKGQPVKQDVYVWRVTATFTNGQPYVAAGDVTVLVTQP
ncbi:MAG TPA: PKD domain-containing protein [Bacteroidales bacterium]|nr:PKD domain-containing protein [Bacteroidales bacterium]